MSRFFSSQGGVWLAVLTQEPLFVADATGVYQPVLAAEVPTVQNGGVAKDFSTVTYKLRPDLKWSDGKPLTADDLAFTQQAYADPKSQPNAALAPHRQVESVKVVNPTTVEVKMKGINLGYLDLWTVVLPKHKFESTAVVREHAQARTPLGTGPFMITDWKAGDSVTMERNPNYRTAGKPGLEGITVKVTPQRQAMLSALTSGQLDYIHFVTASDLPTLAKAEKEGKVALVLQREPTQIEWLSFNMTDNGNPEKPHPVLGDRVIREALDYAIDRKAIIDQVLEGFAIQVGTVLASGWSKVAIAPTPHDPKKANDLLDAAGWVKGGDGIRAKGGVRASIRFTTPSGDAVRELYQQIIQQNAKAVGIELKIDNKPNTTIFGTWQEGGIQARGHFDIVMSRYGGSVDPHFSLIGFTSDNIPSDKNPGGQSYTHWRNREFDAAFSAGAATLDPEARKKAYETAARIWAQERPALPLYAGIRAVAHTPKLKGVKVGHWQLEAAALYGAQDWIVG